MVQLRTMPPFVTMHTFCVSRDIQVSKEFDTNTTIFLHGLWLQCLQVEKADLSKGYQNPKRKLGLTTQIIELKLRKKLPYILFIFF